jgi:hypothetical protein
MKCGSRRAFVTDMYINGEYLRSRTDNQYFCVVDKPRRSATCQATPAISVIWTKPRGSQPRKHVILRLEFVKKKQYFVEGYQAISIKPDATAMDMSLDELRRITPEFKPIPRG